MVWEVLLTVTTVVIYVCSGWDIEGILGFFGFREEVLGCVEGFSTGIGEVVEVVWVDDEAAGEEAF